jgi:hypothetical protein
MNQITSWGEAALTSVAAALALLLAAVPRVIGFLLILLIGWFLANLIARLVAGLLRRVNFNSLADRSGITGFVAGMGIETDAAGFIALIVKWFIRLIALVVAFDALGLPAVSEVLRTFLLWIPNLIVGVLVLVIGGLLANAAAGLVRGAASQAGLGNANMLATIAKTAVWIFAIVVAVNQIGIASTLVNTLFMGVVGAAAVALGLAFGLGGQGTARQIVETWYARAGEADTARLQDAAQAAARMATPRSDPMTPGIDIPPAEPGAKRGPVF